jgi:hypothetical protein
MKLATSCQVIQRIIKQTCATVVFTVVLFCIGCSSSPKQTGPTKADAFWVYAPDQIEIHPLSRFAPSEEHGKDLVYVHVECKDGDDFACRGTGVLTVSLFSKNDTHINTKVVDLGDAKLNYDYFDAVTRTYQVIFDDIRDDCESVTAHATYDGIGERTMQSKSHAIKNYH